MNVDGTVAHEDMIQTRRGEKEIRTENLVRLDGDDTSPDPPSDSASGRMSLMSPVYGWNALKLAALADDACECRRR